MPETIPPPSPPSANPAQTVLAGVPYDVQWDLFSADWLLTAAIAECQDEGPERSDELEEIAAELQESLAFDGQRPKYAVPDLQHLRDLPIDLEARAYCEHQTACDHVADMSTADLAERLEYLHMHRSRTLSALDLAVQREWCVRALGYGYFYGKQPPYLPTQLVELAGRRGSTARRLVLAALGLSLVRRLNGIWISEAEAFSLWGIPKSTWWRVIAWLEKRGLLVRLRQYKNNTSERHTDAPIQLASNWYGPGPELVARRVEVLAAFGDDEDDEARDEAQRLMVQARRDRRRDARRRARGEDTIGDDAPAWIMAVAGTARAEILDAAEHEHAAKRAHEVFEGSRQAVDVLEDDAPEPDALPPSELLDELERIAAGEEIGSAELEQRARLAELEELERMSELERARLSELAGRHRVAELKECVSRAELEGLQVAGHYQIQLWHERVRQRARVRELEALGSSQSAGGSGPSETIAGSAGRGAVLRRPTVAVPSWDKGPGDLETRQEGRPRKAAPRPAEPAIVSLGPEPPADCDEHSAAQGPSNTPASDEGRRWPSRARPEGGARTVPASPSIVAPTTTELEAACAAAGRELEAARARDAAELANRWRDFLQEQAAALDFGDVADLLANAPPSPDSSDPIGKLEAPESPTDQP